MTKRQTPPTGISKALVVVVKPSGPHHCDRCLGSVHTANTRCRGASSSRIAMIAHGSRCKSMLFPAATLLLRLVLRLYFPEVVFQPVEALFPEPAIAFQPVVNATQRLRLDAARPPLRLAAA